MSGNQLTALAAQAAALDSEAAAAAPEAVQQRQEEQEQQEQEISLLQKNGTALSMLLDLAAPTFGTFGMPTAGRVLADHRNKEKLVSAWAPVITKYGIDMSLWGDKYKEEIGAAIVTWPIARLMWQAMKYDAENQPKEPGAGQVVATAEEMPKEPSRQSPEEEIQETAAYLRHHGVPEEKIQEVVRLG
jgi:hypothetical protein